MKRRIFFYFFLLLITSCNYTEKEVVSTYTDGKVAEVCYYRKIGENKICIKRIKYYPSGLMQHRETYNIAGQKDGKWIDWYPNGHKKFLTTYENDLENGKFEAWYENGKRQIVGYYKNGLKDGKWKYYDEKGKKILVQYYKNGELVR